MLKSLAQRSVWPFAYNQRYTLLAGMQRALFRAAYRHIRPAKEHNLPGELIVSLTSFPPRFPTLQHTLESLLNQSVRPDRIILWLDDKSATILPDNIREMDIEVEAVGDIKSYKKLVFALERYPSAFIATADDDIFYAPDWLEHLVEGYDPSSPCITCHRAHRTPVYSGSELPRYPNWEWDVQDKLARTPSPDLLPTTGAGALFFPGSLHEDAIRTDIFTELCPSADDLWFAWQARRAGARMRKVGPKFPLLFWAGSQSGSLFSTNIVENDAQIERLIGAYGWPFATNNTWNSK